MIARKLVFMHGSNFAPSGQVFFSKARFTISQLRVFFSTKKIPSLVSSVMCHYQVREEQSKDIKFNLNLEDSLVSHNLNNRRLNGTLYDLPFEKYLNCAYASNIFGITQFCRIKGCGGTSPPPPPPPITKHFLRKQVNPTI